MEGLTVLRLVLFPLELGGLLSLARSRWAVELFEHGLTPAAHQGRFTGRSSLLLLVKGFKGYLLRLESSLRTLFIRQLNDDTWVLPVGAFFGFSSDRTHW